MATTLAKGTTTGKTGGAALATAERRTARGGAKRPNHTTVYNTRFDHLTRRLRWAGRTTRPVAAFSGVLQPRFASPVRPGSVVATDQEETL
jgi:hypothetical protein